MDYPRQGQVSLLEKTTGATRWSFTLGSARSDLEALTNGTLFTPQVIEMWDGLEDQGHHLAAVGGSDDHRAGMDDHAIPNLDVFIDNDPRI